MLTLVVLAIAHYDQGPPHRPLGIILQHLLFAGGIDGIVKRGATAILHALNSGGQQAHIIGKVLHYLALRIESHGEGAIIMRPKRMLKESDGRLPLELEASMY